MVDAAVIGVQLNRSMVMTPNKSLSFFLRFTTEERASKKAYKCQNCPVSDCKFRAETARDTAPGQ